LGLPIDTMKPEMDWHTRYLQQASWTRQLRDYLMRESGVAGAERVLEVGCGTGAILIDVVEQTNQRTSDRIHIHGLDIQARSLANARRHAPQANLTRGDAHRLPFADRAFDITFCHFLLLWLSDPLAAIREMGRVTRSMGHLLAMAEPDYTARVDHPAELVQIGKLQQRALQDQGADPSIGSRIADLFRNAGLKIVETGTIAPRDPRLYGTSEWQAEWAVLRHDLSGLLPPNELDRLEQLYLHARRSDERMLYVPTFFVHAQV
jgi:ubiquinone/menaquinone biosynthesis C-methylase UbiE